LNNTGYVTESSHNLYCLLLL